MACKNAQESANKLHKPKSFYNFFFAKLSLTFTSAVRAGRVGTLGQAIAGLQLQLHKI
jgi:hypothetical protein